VQSIRVCKFQKLIEPASNLGEQLLNVFGFGQIRLHFNSQKLITSTSSLIKQHLMAEAS
jgi:hypothetical protein